MWTNNSIKLFTVIMIWCCYNIILQVGPVKANLIAIAGVKGIDVERSSEVESSDSEQSLSASSSSSDTSSSVWKSQAFSVLPSSSKSQSTSKSKSSVSQHGDTRIHKSGEEEEGEVENGDEVGGIIGAGDGGALGALVSHEKIESSSGSSSSSSSSGSSSIEWRQSEENLKRIYNSDNTNHVDNMSVNSNNDTSATSDTVEVDDVDSIGGDINEKLKRNRRVDNGHITSISDNLEEHDHEQEHRDDHQDHHHHDEREDERYHDSSPGSVSGEQNALNNPSQTLLQLQTLNHNYSHSHTNSDEELGQVFVNSRSDKSSSSSTSTSSSSSVSSLAPSSSSQTVATSPITTTVSTEQKALPPRGDQEEKLLLNYLMRGYERDIRPVVNASQPVVIEVGITLTQIFDFDEKNQVLTTNVWLDQEWNDELLQWNPSEFGGLESIRLPCDRIWLPDIVLYNNADDYTQGYMPSRAMISHNGKVFWPPPTKFRSTCPVDVTYFPFDDQICTLKLGSWTYNGFQVDVMNRTSDVDLTNYVANGEWELLQAELQRNVVFYTCCPEPFPDVTITLIIRRKTLYYIYNIVLPCMMLSVLTLLVFCLPPDSGEKIALGITVLLAFSVFMLAIAEKMPETSESIPLIGIYLTAVMAITSFSVILTVVVLNLHYLGPQVRTVPPYLRYFLPKEKRFRQHTNNASGIRKKSWLIPVTHRERGCGSLKRSHVLLPPQRSGGDVAFIGTNPNIVSLSTSASTGGGGNGNSSLRGVGTGGDHHHLTQETDVIKETLSECSECCSSTESVTNESPGNLSKSGRSSAGAINYHPHHHNTKTLHHRHHHHQQHNRQPPPLNSNINKGAQHSTTSHNNSPSCETTKEFYNCSAPENPNNTIVNPTNTTSNGRAAGDVQEELLKSIRHLISKQEEVEAQNILVAEWRLVAQAIDKTLFWIVFVVTFISSAMFLVILPLYKRSFYGPKPPR